MRKITARVDDQIFDQIKKKNNLKTDQDAVRFLMRFYRSQVATQNLKTLKKKVMRKKASKAGRYIDDGGCC